MSESEIIDVVADEKEFASLQFRLVARYTRENFPEAAYRPDGMGGIRAGSRVVKMKMDGVGTKPELAERLRLGGANSFIYSGLAFDGAAMVLDDAAAEGIIPVGLGDVLDVSSARNRDDVIAFADGINRACNRARVALISGETAELGYRTAGIGETHVNWNMAAQCIEDPEKRFDSRKLRPGMPIVGLRERSIRSNGLTRARAILEAAFLARMSVPSRVEFVRAELGDALGVAVSSEQMEGALKHPSIGPALRDHVHVPWHQEYPELTLKLLTPSTIYSPLICEAQGWVDGRPKIPILAAAHITGGSVPLKGGRMLEGTGLGMNLTETFPEPEGVAELMAMGKPLGLIDGASACRQWNMGVGFLCALPDRMAADAFCSLAAERDYEAKLLGLVTQDPLIRWCGHAFKYERKSN